ncbi:MAG: periplasmic heavy metal sensor [Rubrivivax sp.]|nr:periplasmic heavy metal sensor [Rubrivivax sp.]
MQVSALKLTQHPLRLLTATLTLALAAGFVQTVQAQPYGGMGGPGAMGRAGSGMGHGMGAGMEMGGAMASERMLVAVKATAEQRAQIQQIMLTARTEMSAQRDAGIKLRDQARALFTQPTVDANAAEALRLQMLAQHDQASKRMLQAMLEVSRVLTPEQRKIMADRMAQRSGMMARHRAEREALVKPAR